jgi:hypothetical protein
MRNANKMRECQTYRGAPDHAQDLPRHGEHIDEGGQSSDQADRYIESHRPALSAQIITIHMIGVSSGHDRRRSGVFAHSPILACRERLLTIVMAIP